MTTRPVTIVVLTKYMEVFTPFHESVKKFLPDVPLVIVKDGAPFLELDKLQEWHLVPDKNENLIIGPKKFAMAGNGNIGWQAVPADHDILYCGDDIRFLQEDTIEKLQAVAYANRAIGILSPKIEGRASPTLAAPKGDVVFVKPLEMWFPCVYIKREVLNAVGYLDERFNDFGSDDLDYNIRVLKAGYKLACTSLVTVVHEASPEGGPTTFVKRDGVESWHKQETAAVNKLGEKWHATNEIMMHFLTTGDPTYLSESEDKNISAPMRPRTNEEAMRFLKTRSIYIATPAYGGLVNVNYVNSIIGLINMCRDIGIQHSIAYIYNESLITRGRNKMVDDYLKNSDFTDFFFIDADIGFNPNDIITLLLHEGEVIGAPCVRKNLRLDRIVQAVRENHREYSLPELQKMIGEFVVNFVPDKQPTTINLGNLIEVMDVGTGLIRIRRDVFGKVAKAFPDRQYLAPGGELGDFLPMYMYFQAERDLETAKYNPENIPHYIPEDYSFCRLCRRAGINVYLAPWIKTTHMGSYVYEGDMQAVAAAGGRLRRG